MEKIIRLQGNKNKVYFPTSILSIEHIDNDRNGNIYTRIVFTDGSSIRVSDHIDDILYNLRKQYGDLELEEYQYKIEGKVI